MATKKSSGRKSSSGSDPKSKKIVKKKVGKAMHEFKHHELKSGRSGKQVTNPKQAIAIGLSEARHSGADIPPDPNRKKSAKKGTAKKGEGMGEGAKTDAPRKSSRATKKNSTK